MDQVARQLGVDQATAEAATRAAIPALLGGMEANAQDEAGARSLAAAVGEHDQGLLDGGVDIDRVDTTDGDKIVSNVFGANRDKVVDQLGGIDGLGGKGGGGMMGKLLPILAPIVLAFLAKKMMGGGATGSGAESAGSAGGIGDILGGMLGGGSSGAAGGGLGDLGGLGDILGGLLGGGKR